METKVLIALFVAGLLAFTAAVDGDSNGSDSGSESLGSWGDSFEQKDDDCDRLVEGSDDNDGKCDLTDGLEEIPDEAECTPEEKTTIINWVAILKGLLKVKGYSVQERLSIALSSIQKFQMEYPAIYDKIAYQNISGWGFVASFSKVVQYRLSFQLESLVTMDVDDNCPLFDALWNCTDGSEAQESAVNALINETLYDICANTSISIKQKYVLIYQALADFFAINTQWQFSFFQYHIAGFGSFQQIYEITKTYYQVTQVDAIFQWETSPAECQFMISFKQSLELVWNDASVDNTVKSTLKVFYDRCFGELNKPGLSGKKMLSIIMREFRSFIQLYGWKYAQYTFGCYIEGFGSFWDLINCGPWKIPLPPKTTPAFPPSPKPTCACTCEPLLSTLLP